MKLKFDKQESELLQLIKAHTGCETRSAVALLADLKHLESGNPGHQRANPAETWLSLNNRQEL